MQIIFKTGLHIFISLESMTKLLAFVSLASSRFSKGDHPYGKSPSAFSLKAWQCLCFSSHCLLLLLRMKKISLALGEIFFVLNFCSFVAPPTNSSMWLWQFILCCENTGVMADSFTEFWKDSFLMRLRRVSPAPSAAQEPVQAQAAAGDEDSGSWRQWREQPQEPLCSLPAIAAMFSLFCAVWAI